MVRRMLMTVLISIVATLAVAVLLVLTQTPADLPAGEGLDFTHTLDRDQPDPLPLTQVPMRDGFPLQVRRLSTTAEDAPLLILVHGSGWHGQQFDAMALDLSQAHDVVVPDLRGHGVAPGRRGDIDYIDQFEDDLADLIEATAKPEQKVVLGGHSSGGGLVVRFAGGAHGGLLDGAVLMAPFLHHRSETSRENSGGWAHVLLRRIIGLSILNTFQIKALNHLPIIQFRMPQVVLDGPLGNTATTAYSYRLNTGFAPRSGGLKEVAKLPPFILIAGSADESFVASRYEPTLSALTDQGSYHIVEGVGHLDIVHHPKTKGLIEEFLNGI